MKKQVKNLVRILIVLSLGALAAGCSNGSDTSDLKMSNWGPQSMTIGEIPNKQPTGNMGVWIQVAGKKDGDYQVQFDGHSLEAVGGDANLITAGVPPDLLGAVGTKEITIKEIKTGKTYVAGKFVINSVQSQAGESKK
jgi:hypothetical protein